MLADLRQNYNQLSMRVAQLREAGDLSGEMAVNLTLMELDLTEHPDLWPLPEHTEDMSWS